VRTARGRLHSDHPLKNSGYFGRIQKGWARESDVASMKRSGQLMGLSGVSAYSASDRSCRICFEGRETGSNPLFNVCLCTGTVKYVHFECLRSWFRSKTVRFEAPHCLYYCYEPLQCEICRYAISNEVLHQGRRYCLFDYEQIHPPFAKLEHYADARVFEILIRLEEPLTIAVGRGVENDLNLNDSSISRSHCALEYSSQRLWLRGQACKYGSFVELGKSVEMGENPVGLAVGNHMVWLSQCGGKRGGCCSTEEVSLLQVR
jgi:hypothetical protein